jgi:hypothetical protein
MRQTVWETLAPLALCWLLASGGLAAAEPIKLHPDNPHYFLFRGKPTLLVTSGEHYGAVLNRDFDYVRYLDVLQERGFNLTRTFSGAYREVPGSFGIKGNTLAPAKGRFLCPWARSQTPGASDGGAKFDLDTWDEAYFERLKDFVTQAGKRGIVVELVLFCTMYDDTLWEASPMNAKNNINGVGNVGRSEVFDGKDQGLLAVQQAMTRKLASELRDFDNVYFEVCNEPYERAGQTPEWTAAIIAAIVEAEADLPAKHLIAQGIAVRAAKAEGVSEHVSVLNFHAATPEAVRLNYGLKRVIADDETGGSDQSDRKYRTEGWDFLLAGGGVYDHLDFSFTTDRPDGTAVPLAEGVSGGGSPELRKQLQILKEFIEGFDFIKLAPAEGVVKSLESTPRDAKVTARVLSEAGKAYAIYSSGGESVELTLDIPAGDYRAEWVNTKTGKIDKAESFTHAGGDRVLSSPSYMEDIALRVKKVSSRE